MNRILEQFGHRPLNEEERARVAKVRDIYIRAAHEVAEAMGDGPDLTVALRELVASKDTAIRGIIFQAPALKADLRKPMTI